MRAPVISQGIPRLRLAYGYDFARNDKPLILEFASVLRSVEELGPTAVENNV